MRVRRVAGQGGDVAGGAPARGQRQARVRRRPGGRGDRLAVEHRNGVGGRYGRRHDPRRLRVGGLLRERPVRPERVAGLVGQRGLVYGQRAGGVCRGRGAVERYYVRVRRVAGQCGDVAGGAPARGQLQPRVRRRPGGRGDRLAVGYGDVAGGRYGRRDDLGGDSVPDALG